MLQEDKRLGARIIVKLGAIHARKEDFPRGVTKSCANRVLKDSIKKMQQWTARTFTKISSVTLARREDTAIRAKQQHEQCAWLAELVDTRRYSVQHSQANTAWTAPQVNGLLIFFSMYFLYSHNIILHIYTLPNPLVHLY